MRMIDTRWLPGPHARWLGGALCVAAAVAACGGGGGMPESPAAKVMSVSADRKQGNITILKVLGNRADLISGGQALVEAVLPSKAKAEYGDLRILRNGKDVTAAFAVRENGRYMGLVEGLRDGVNELVARVPNGPGARLMVTNHPNGGPVISGPQVGPWTCTTKVDNPSANNPDLGAPIDAQCDIAAPVFRWQYRTLTGGFQPYDPLNPPAADQIARTTTDEGKTVPYIVRIERGVINRGKYDLATLADPADPTAGWAPWARVDNWNRKLFWKFGSGCDFQRVQGNPGNVMDDNALSRGFMVASSEMTQYGTHCNDVTSTETVIMVKEYITEHYGEIRYTMSDGGSGGAHQQNLTASNYPGLLQGLMPTVLFQDTWTPGREFVDCGLLKRYHDAHAGTPLEMTNWQRALVAGHRWQQVCEGPANTNMASRTPYYIDPSVGCGDPVDQWSLANPNGVRCTLQDYQKSVFGPRDATGWARSPLDNVGLQYGFRALNEGRISPEQFVTMNEEVGGYDINGQWQPARMHADRGAAQIAEESGRVSNGYGLGEVAIIDLRLFDITEEHYDFRSWVIRNRIQAVWGNYDNQVIWRYKSNPPDLAARAFDTMNRWLMAVESDTSNRSLRKKIIANKPAEAVDSCWRADLGVWSTDTAYCNTGLEPSMAASVVGTGADAIPEPTQDEWPVYRDTRVAAGEPLTSDVMKCRLKRPDKADYKVHFTATQWARLHAAFPDGVCDWSKPGLGQRKRPPQWQTFMHGPGGQPLGDPPVSKPGDGRGI